MLTRFLPVEATQRNPGIDVLLNKRSKSIENLKDLEVTLNVSETCGLKSLTKDA